MKHQIQNFFPLAVFCLALTASATTRYVDLNSSSPTPPYTNWPTAATNIQDAIDASVDGDLVLVTNGVYQTGGGLLYGALTNRVVVTKLLTVQSANGPEVTMIIGNPVIGDSAVRCAFLTNGAVLSGFTLTGGATRDTGNIISEMSGGGVIGMAFDANSASRVTNCILTGNSAVYGGGGASGVALRNCVVSNNIASGGKGGGVYGSFVYGCLIYSNSASQGGGVNSAYLYDSLIMSNFASADGGGCYAATPSNCVFSANIAGGRGGGIGGVFSLDGRVVNCVVTNNQALRAGGIDASGSVINCVIAWNSASNYAGAAGPKFSNCVIWQNTASDNGGGFTGTAKNSIIYDNFPVNVDTNLGAGMNYCDTLPLPTSGAQNLTNVPLFVDAANGNFRLQPNSPCINAGYNAYATNFPDLEGNPRIVGGTVDIGAYEFQSPVSQISYAWLQQYGLPINGSTDSADTDGDGHNNWQEWRAGTIPTNAASVLKLFSPTGDVSGLTLRWQSVTTRTYWLERATNLPTFSTIATNLPGQSSTTAYLDSTATNAGAYFYRVGAKE